MIVVWIIKITFSEGYKVIALCNSNWYFTLPNINGVVLMINIPSIHYNGITIKGTHEIF